MGTSWGRHISTSKERRQRTSSGRWQGTSVGVTQRTIWGRPRTSFGDFLRTSSGGKIAEWVAPFMNKSGFFHNISHFFVQNSYFCSFQTKNLFMDFCVCCQYGCCQSLWYQYFLLIVYINFYLMANQLFRNTCNIISKKFIISKFVFLINLYQQEAYTKASC